jgi:hypothetical protein
MVVDGMISEVAQSLNMLLVDWDRKHVVDEVMKLLGFV